MNIDQLKYCTEQFIAPRRKAVHFKDTSSTCEANAVTGIYYPPLGQFVCSNAIELQRAQELHQQSTNPDYPHLRQIITTLVDWKQIQTYCLRSAETQLHSTDNSQNLVQLPTAVFNFDADDSAEKSHPSKKRKRNKNAALAGTGAVEIGMGVSTAFTSALPTS